MNFGAGPGTLPLAALERAQREFIDIEGTGMSVLEHSHRGSTYEKIHLEALALVRELGAVPESHEILLLQGGATMQFGMIPMNFLRAGDAATYAVSGTWGEKALEDAKTVAQDRGAKVLEASTAAAKGCYTRAASQADLGSTAGQRYVHITSNETIHGIQMGSAEAPFPSIATGGHLICDMSSDFLSRKADLAPFSLVYAGAQKNVGPSGLCVVIIRKDLLAESNPKLPSMLRYDVAAKGGSMHNTPPTFAVYLMRNVLLWLKGEGGAAALGERNAKKAACIYGVINAHPALYACPVEVASRSQMNVIFRLPSEELEKQFLKGAEERKMHGLKGHRSVGGMRVSLYNAVPMEWCEALAEYMATFAKTHG
jgi:phosphoserine aminotransferase